MDRALLPALVPALGVAAGGFLAGEGFARGRAVHPFVTVKGVAELVNAGVVLSSGDPYGSGGPTFIFSGLSKLKPEMIAEATAHARAGAEQFARDSKSQVEEIKEANQGVFQILPRDQAQGITEESQVLKTVRVVSTIRYFLRPGPESGR